MPWPSSAPRPTGRGSAEGPWGSCPAWCRLDQHFCCIAELSGPRGTERVSLISADVERRARSAYIERYYALDPARRSTSPSTSLFQVNWESGEYARDEFAADFMRGLMHAGLSAGVPLLAPGGGGGVMFGFTRSRPRALSRRDESILRMLRPHLANYYAVFRRLGALPGRHVHPAELAPGARLLSAREAEIAHLLCRGMRPAEIATMLLVSPRTVERHIEHIYEKLNVRSRPQLLRLLLPC